MVALVLKRGAPMATVAPGSVQASSSRRTLSLYSAVNFRRFGRSLTVKARANSPRRVRANSPSIDEVAPSSNRPPFGALIRDPTLRIWTPTLPAPWFGQTPHGEQVRVVLRRAQGRRSRHCLLEHDCGGVRGPTTLAHPLTAGRTAPSARELGCGVAVGPWRRPPTEVHQTGREALGSPGWT